MPRLAQAALIALLLLALIGAAALERLPGGRLPLFQQILAAGPAFTLVVENGHFCFPEAALAACRSIVREELRVWYYAGGARRELITHVWER